MGTGIAALGVAEPLDRADADGRIERPGPHRDALPNVGEQEVALDVPLQSDVEHRGGNVHADPHVGTALRGRDRGQDVAGETGAAADVEHEGRGLETEELESPVGHVDLHILDARGGGVFAGFGVVVKEVGWAIGMIS